MLKNEKMKKKLFLMVCAACSAELTAAVSAVPASEQFRS